MVGSYEWQAKAMSTMKTAKWHPLVLFSPPDITQAAKSMDKLISQLCGELQPAIGLSRGDMEPNEDHPSTLGSLISLR